MRLIYVSCLLLGALKLSAMLLAETSTEKNSNEKESVTTGQEEVLPAPRWYRVDIGIIGTSAIDVLESAFENAKKQSSDGILIVLDTPGGVLDVTRDIVKLIMGAERPVVVWVGPDGSRAGSAGAFITISAHVAAMAPGTNIGAATPIQSNGKDIDNEDVARKIENDTAAFMESIAKSRGRNAELATSFVVTGASIAADEALENNIIDIIAKDAYELMNKIHGREIELQSGDKVKIHSRGASFVDYERSTRQRFLEIVSNPNLFYLLFMAGLIGLGFELTHPGSIFPGVVGGICMILALVATSVLPINFGAMLLILAGVCFLVGEMFLPSFGILGLGGLIAIGMGSVLLIDPSNELGLRISMYAILPVTLTVAGIALGIGYLIFRSETSKVKSGAEGMLGQSAHAVTDFSSGKGRASIMGEDWHAVLQDRDRVVSKGDSLKVVKVNGLTLVVQPESTSSVEG